MGRHRPCQPVLQRHATGHVDVFEINEEFAVATKSSVETAIHLKPGDRKIALGGDPTCVILAGFADHDDKLLAVELSNGQIPSDIIPRGIATTGCKIDSDDTAAAETVIQLPGVSELRDHEVIGDREWIIAFTHIQPLPGGEDVPMATILQHLQGVNLIVEARPEVLPANRVRRGVTEARNEARPILVKLR